MDRNIIVYTKNNCGICENVKRWLNWANISYEEINIEDDNKAIEYIKNNLGYQAMPVIEVTNTNGTKYDFQGFNAEELAKLKV